MARVFIPALLRELAGGQTEIEVSGATVREVIAALDAPLAARLLDGNGALRANLALAVDGEIVGTDLSVPVEDATEIHFVAAIKGGVR